jgi:hypothetical protein
VRSHLTYANVVATLALFLSLAGGTAVAARLMTGRDVRDSSLTGKDVRDRSLTAKDLRRGIIRPPQPGPEGPTGPAGPAGQTGSAGADGAQGPAGRGVLEPLRTGETITGGFWLQGRAFVAGEVEADFIPLGALTQDPIVTADAFINGVGAEPCTGSSTTPTAPLGVLCVYPASTFNVAARQLANVTTTDAARRRGFSALITSAAGGTGGGSAEYGFSAVWAYTEP